MSIVSNESISSFISSLKQLNGSAGNKRLQSVLGWSDSEYEAVRNDLVRRNVVRIGRGRGGTVILVSEVESNVQREPVEVEAEVSPEAPAESVAVMVKSDEDSLRAGANFDVENIKARYAPMPENPEAFEVGMHVFRPPTYLFTKEADAWKNLRHYVVVGHKEHQVILRPHNVKDATPEAANPKGFFVSAKGKHSKAA